MKGALEKIGRLRKVEVDLASRVLEVEYLAGTTTPLAIQPLIDTEGVSSSRID